MRIFRYGALGTKHSGMLPTLSIYNVKIQVISKFTWIFQKFQSVTHFYFLFLILIITVPPLPLSTDVVATSVGVDVVTIVDVTVSTDDG